MHDISDQPGNQVSQAVKSHRPRVIIVLGMHRSGTSALAGTFSQLGLNLGDELIPATADANPKGYFEHAQVVHVHDHLLAAFGMDWQDPRPLPEGWRTHPVAHTARARLLALMGDLVADGGIAVVKDPRMCRFVPLWLDVLDERGVDVHFAFIARHPVEVAASLRRRDDMSEYRAGLLTLAHQMEAEQATRGRSRVFLTYEDLVADWRGQIGRCYRAFGLGEAPLDGPLAAAVDGFLDSSLRNHRAESEHALDPAVFAIYRAVRAASVGGGDTTPEPAFDAVWPAFEAARRGYGASMEAVMTALALDHRQRSVGVEALSGTWGSVPMDDHLALAPMLYLRRADAEYSEGAALRGRMSPAGAGRYEASFDIAAGMPLERLRFDPDEKPGVYTVDAVSIDGVPVVDLPARLVAFNGHAVQLQGGVEWATPNADPWVEFDLAGLAANVAPAGGARIGLRFRRLTSHAVLEQAAAVRHQEQAARVEALTQLVDGIGAAVQHSRELHGSQLDHGLGQLEQGLGQLEDRLGQLARDGRQDLQAFAQQAGQRDAELDRRIASIAHAVERLAESVDELKARSDRPLLHRLRRWRTRRRLRSSAVAHAGDGGNTQLQALANIEVDGDRWVSRNADPQLSVTLLSSDGQPLVAGQAGIGGGWHLLTIQAQAHDGLLVNPCLYPDYGPGINESERIDLPEYDAQGRIEAWIFLRADVRTLRFDPSSQDVVFSLGLALQPTGRPAALLGMARHVWRTQGADASARRRLLGEALTQLLAGGPTRMRKAIFERYAALQRSGGSEYATWLRRFEPRLRASDIDARLATLAQRPRFSVVMPVYNAPAQWLRRAIESVQAQSYPDWELCICDDASPSPEVRPVLEAFAQSDTRIRVEYRAKNGHISESSNSALALANGDFMALLDHDDELHPDALLVMAEAIAANPRAKLLYSDEDKIDEAGTRFQPYFKPDWNYDLFLGQNCISHLGVYALPLVREIGGFRKGLEGSQDWDLALRCIEKLEPDQIHHVPRVLYHWRAIQGSTALGADQKDYATLAGQRAVQEHLQRTGQRAEVEIGALNMLRVSRALPEPEPMVSLIIPTRDRVDLLRMCVDSILSGTTYAHYEILIVDNGSVEAETLAYFDSLAGDARVRVLPYPHPFNYSAINNHAARQARGQILGLVNNDIEVIEPGWLGEMVSHVVRPDIGAVGAMLYYPNDTIQHAGVLIGVGGVAAHIGSREARGAPGYFGRMTLAQELSAVTAACLLVRREVFEEVGGLDEQLKVAFNDVDLCMRIGRQGYRNLWTPHAELYHHESASRGLEDNPEKLARFQSEIAFMQDRWGVALDRDRAYNPNLSLRVPFTLGDLHGERR